MNRREGKRLALLLLCIVGAVLFAGLGVWQIERRAWKLDLIERVQARVHAAPVAVPPSSAWARLNPRDIEYRRVRVSGIFEHDRQTLVQALTERGAGYWLLTPLRTNDGTIIINRGFIPTKVEAPASRSAGQQPAPVTLTGLMRLTEPNGRFLRQNRPAQNRWYSRDVAAIAQRQGIGPVAPFFIDADAQANRAALPVGGLTVVSFRNMHLVYALTWFGLAAMCLIAGVLVTRADRSTAIPLTD